MKFVVHCLDHANAGQKRLDNYAAHRSYLAESEVKVVISGPLLGADHETMIGSLFVIEANSREEVECFNAADPFHKAGVWAQVLIHPFSLRVDNRV